MNEDRKKLLVLASTYPRWENDHMPPFVHNLALSFLRRYDVTVLAPHTEGSARKEVLHDVNVERFRYAWPSSLQRLAYRGGIMNNMRSDPLAVMEVLPFFGSQLYNSFRLARSLKPDVINSHWLIPQGLIGGIVSSLTGIPHVITVHGGDFFALIKSSPGRALMRWILAGAHGIVSVSSLMMADMEKVANRKLQGMVAPMGVRVEEAGFELEAERKVEGKLFFVGRLVEKKGVKVLLHAMKELLGKGADLKLDIAGDGPLSQRLNNVTKELKLESRVTFLGALGRNEVMEQIRSADALIVPSVIDSSGETEGMPVVILEAFSQGVPVIASKVSGIPDVVKHGVNGLLVESNDASKLAQAIGRFYDETDINKMRRQSLKTSKSYTTDAITDRYMELFDSLKRGVKSEQH